MKRFASLALAVLLVASAMVGSVGTIAASTATASPGQGNGHGQSTTTSGGNTSDAPGNGNGRGQPAHAGPPGHVGVPSSNVEVGNGVGEGNRGPPAHAAAWGVSASKHAGDLSVRVEAVETGGVRLVLTDDQNHAGREVSVSASALSAALGYLPSEASGRHETGQQWTSTIEYEGQNAVFSVPRFSTNYVSFEGEVSLSSPSATDGATLTYGLANVSAASDPTGTLTGVEATEWDNVSATGLGDGDTLAVNPAGHRIAGPNAGEPEVVLTGNLKTTARSPSGSVSPGGSASISIGGNQDPQNPTLTVTGRGTTHSNPAYNSYDYWYGIAGDGSSQKTEIGFDGAPSVVSALDFYVSGQSGTTTVDIYIVEEMPDRTYGEGTLVGDNIDISGTGQKTIDIQDYQPSSDGPLTIEFVTVSGTATKEISINDRSSGSGNWVYSTAGGDFDNWAADMSLIESPSGVSVSDNTGASASFGDLLPGETKSKSLGVTTSSSTLDFSSFKSGSVDWQLDYTERTITDSPALDLDGDGTNEVSHSGTLSDGETATYQLSSLDPSDGATTISTGGGSTVDVDVRLQEVTRTRNADVTLNGQQIATVSSLADGETHNFSASSDLLQDGTNSVTIAVGDGSLSADAPTPRVGFEMSHSARYDRSVAYDGEQWSERYNVSRTWGDANENASVSIPFEGNVVGIRGLQVFVNGTETAPTWSRFGANSTTLQVGLGDLNPAATTRVVATGSKVRVENGSINVLEPSLLGDGLDSKVEFVSWSSDSHIDVSGTSKSDRVHYLASPSWDGSEDYATVRAGGTQLLHAPNAADGSTARVQTVPMALDLDAGATEVAVTDASVPRFEVREGDTAGTDRIEIQYFDVLDGERYALLEQPDDSEVRAEEASGGSVSFATGSFGTFTIEQRDSSGGGPIGDPEVVVGATGEDGSSPFSILAVFGGMAGSILGALLIGRKFFGVRGFRASGVVVLVGAVAGLVGIEMATSESVVGGLLGAVLATDAGIVVITIGLLLAIWQLHRWLSLPPWLRVAAGLAVGIWAVDGLSDGALTATLDRLGPLVWLILLVGGIALLWRALQGPTFIIGGERQ